MGGQSKQAKMFLIDYLSLVSDLVRCPTSQGVLVGTRRGHVEPGIFQQSEKR